MINDDCWWLSMFDLLICIIIYIYLLLLFSFFIMSLDIYYSVRCINWIVSKIFFSLCNVFIQLDFFLYYNYPCFYWLIVMMSFLKFVSHPQEVGWCTVLLCLINWFEHLQPSWFKIDKRPTLSPDIIFNTSLNSSF